MLKEFLLQEKSKKFLHYSTPKENLYLYPSLSKSRKSGAYALSGYKLERGEFEFVVRHGRKFLRLISDSENKVKFLLVQKGRLIY